MASKEQVVWVGKKVCKQTQCVNATLITNLSQEVLGKLREMGKDRLLSLGHTKPQDLLSPPTVLLPRIRHSLFPECCFFRAAFIV